MCKIFIILALFVCSTYAVEQQQPKLNSSTVDPLSTLESLVDTELSDNETTVLNYNSRIFTVKNLVQCSMDGYRRLLENPTGVDAFMRDSVGFPKSCNIKKLKPLTLNSPVMFEHRDGKNPTLGKIRVTLDNIEIDGVASFNDEKIKNCAFNIEFEHTIPKLDTISNFSVDYFLFDEVPLRISEGHVKATITNAKVQGTFRMFPELYREWFRIDKLNMSTCVQPEDIDLMVYPSYLISDRFVIERSTLEKLNSAIQSIMPQVNEYLKYAYTRAVELRP